MFMNQIYNKQTTLNLNGQLFDLSAPRIMGILNITPDSFFDGGNYTNADSIEKRIDQMINEGVDIIDIGAYSSRPGAQNISENEELKRLSFALDIIREKGITIPLSVDTFRSKVAEWVIKQYRVEIINDISGGDLDSKIYDVLAKHNAAYVMMHMRGKPQTMSQLTHYDNLMADMLKDLSTKVRQLKNRGVNDIIIDPGFGFAKDLDQNYHLLSQLHLFNIFELPLLVGVSRKSMIYKLFDQTPQESLNGTTAINMIALMQGADILRVHDIKAAKECVEIYNKTRSTLC